MTKKITMIIGEPCVGKSTIVRSAMSEIDGGFDFIKIKHTPHHISRDGKNVILGRYDEEEHPYPGTDRLSMSVHNAAHAFIERKAFHGFNVLFEGDRLGNWSSVFYLQNFSYRLPADFQVILIGTSPEILADRRELHRKDQSKAFWKSRNTKIKNLNDNLSKSAVNYKLMINNSDSDIQCIAEYLIKERLS